MKTVVWVLAIIFLGGEDGMVTEKLGNFEDKAQCTEVKMELQARVDKTGFKTHTAYLCLPEYWVRF